MASDTRDRLVRATSRLLRTQGYSATGLNQIMSEAGAPKGSMYFHFPGGKVELAGAAVDRFADRSRRLMHENLAAHDTVADGVTAIFDGYIRHMERTGYREGCAVATVALDAAATHASLADATGRAFRTWTGDLAAALEAEGREPTEAENLATLVIASIEGSLTMAKGQQSTQPIAAARDALAAILAPPAADG